LSLKTANAKKLAVPSRVGVNIRLNGDCVANRIGMSDGSDMSWNSRTSDIVFVVDVAEIEVFAPMANVVPEAGEKLMFDAAICVYPVRSSTGSGDEELPSSGRIPFL